MSLESFFQTVQKACLPGVWSKGVQLARDHAVTLDKKSPTELLLRVKVAQRPVSPKVSLWPEDEDWHCDCGDRIEPCMHIAAAIIALRSGLEAGATAASSGPVSAAGPSASLAYSLRRSEAGELLFERRLIQSGSSKSQHAEGMQQQESPFTESLVSLAGGIQSGRVALPGASFTQADFAVDRALGDLRSQPTAQVPRALWPALLKALEDVPRLTLDGAGIQVSARAVGLVATLTDAHQGAGFRLKIAQDPTVTEGFKNGVALCGTTLRPLELPELTREELEYFTPSGKYFPRSEAPRLVSRTLADLKRKLNVQIQTTLLPEITRAEPRVVLELQTLGSSTLGVVPRILYGDPPLAELRGGELKALRDGIVVERDVESERRLSRKLQTELHLQLESLTRFQGEEAILFRQRARAWDVQGSGREAFELYSELRPVLRFTGSDARGAFELEFTTTDATTAGKSPRSAGGAEVMRAWQRGDPYVSLLGGGFARLPTDWLARYGAQIQSLLESRTHSQAGALPASRLPELVELAQELGAEIPEELQEWKRKLARLEHLDGLPEARLPRDLRADLRSYQLQGVRWLSALRDSGLGALLADDMGLGKTLQALCVLKGRTLIIAPASVMRSWAEQIERFRPGLKVALYYGPGRKLDPAAEVTLTTYAILRIDAELLAREPWETLVLDEAQTLKNPESQVAQAARKIQASFRLHLSGTPVENRLEDLWSQFQMLHPGLLGSRTFFQEHYAGPIARGDAEAAQKLRRRVGPFLLRRLKRQVAPELPARTETVLYCELSAQESELYRSLLASARSEVLKQLDDGASVMAALELLLRLRQSCCHTALVPGSRTELSSKTALLLETLETSSAEGHRSLVFSQWTSLLDRIEPGLKERGISFARLDGSTPNAERARIVSLFQSAGGPSVLLLSLKAGGVGLTLTAADQVVLMDPWWNPTVEDQAADRAHRIGQQNPVLIQRLIAKDTIEEKILELQKRKRELAAIVLSESDATASQVAKGSLPLTREDLLELLS